MAEPLEQKYEERFRQMSEDAIAHAAEIEQKLCDLVNACTDPQQAAVYDFWLRAVQRNAEFGEIMISLLDNNVEISS